MFSKIDLDENPFVIAEVGQNHQGDLDTAREYIRIFAFEGADAVKFQTRNNKYLFSKNAYNSEYTSENAFAKTYGEHREKLELKPEWLPILKDDCEKYGVKFISTPFDEPSLNLLEEIGVDAYKIASFDLGNLPFLNRIGKTGRPVVMSVGGGKIDHIKSSLDVLLKHEIELAVLHCVSEYPTEYTRLGLENIKILEKAFPQCVIGSSDHFNGTLSGPIAYMSGARVFEKHVTLNRASKGTDHSFALEPEGFRKFVRDIRRVKHMFPSKPEGELGTEYVFTKLGKSLIANTKIKKGEVFSLDNLSGQIVTLSVDGMAYIPVRNSHLVIGRKTKRDIEAGSPLLIEDIEKE